MRIIDWFLGIERCKKCGGKMIDDGGGYGKFKCDKCKQKKVLK